MMARFRLAVRLAPIAITSRLICSSAPGTKQMRKKDHDCTLLYENLVIGREEVQE